MDAIQHIIIDYTLARIGDSAFADYLCHASSPSAACCVTAACRLLTSATCSDSRRSHILAAMCRPIWVQNRVISESNLDFLKNW